MNKKITGLALSLTLCATAVYAAPIETGPNSPYTAANANQAKVVVYRGDKGYYGRLTRAYVDIDGKDPLAALSTNEHVVFCVRPGEHMLGTHHEDAIIYNSKNRNEQKVLFEAGKTYRFKIQDEERSRYHPTNVVALDQFQRETPSSTYQEPKNTQNKDNVVVPCDGYVAPPPPPPPPVPVPVKPSLKELTLGADGLFAFDRSGTGDLLPEGKRKIETLANDLQAYNVQHIDVIGYTDRLGTDSYNMRLSHARAETVKAYLVSKGVNGSLISTEGRGKQDPVKECSNGLPKAELTQCLLPNRRVVIRIVATTKN